MGDGKKQENKPHSVRLSSLVKQVNKFYLDLFYNELNWLQDLGVISQNWIRSISRLLEQLKPQFDSNRMMLVRIGKNTGAESKSYRTKGVAKIKIIGKGNSKYLEHATTVWLATERCDARSDMYPLGWALIEINPIVDNSFLLEWVQQQKKHSFNRLLIIEEQQRYQKENQEKQQIAEEERILRERKRKQEEENYQQLLELLTNNQKRVQELFQKISNATEKGQDTKGNPLFEEYETLVSEAISNWEAKDRHYFASTITRALLAEKVVNKWIKYSDEKKFNKAFINKLKK